MSKYYEYYVTGVQLGMLIALEKKDREKIVEEIIDKQFLGNVKNENKKDKK